MGWALKSFSLVIMVVGVHINGCAAQRGVDTEAMRGKLLSEVVAEYRLKDVQAWPDMNMPPGSDMGTTYFLEKGNLYLTFSGEPPVVREADYQASEKMAQERMDGTNAAWSEWVKAHSGRGAR